MAKARKRVARERQERLEQALKELDHWPKKERTKRRDE